MNAFLAIMLESYRELNSRKLFWITMILSGVVVLAFLGIGLDEGGLSLLGFDLPDFGVNSTTIPPEVFFKQMFIQFGIAFWLAWIASVLALVTTAEIFPSLLSHGAIDMVLSKPIRRLSLFTMKFVGGLLFMGLQVAVFCAACFAVIGVKTGAWEPGLFLAVPIMMLFFSYLFAVCVLFGILTRSSIASLLLTLLVWFVIWIANTADGGLVTFRSMAEQRTESIETRLERQDDLLGLLEQRVEEATDEEARTARTARLEQARSLRAQLVEERSDAESSLEDLAFWSDIVFGVKTVLPKTAETVGLLERWLVAAADLQPDPEAEENEEDPAAADEAALLGDDPDAPPPPSVWNFQPDQDELEADVQAEFRGRSVAWIIGTSLAFELLVLAFAAWRFQRRDF